MPGSKQPPKLALVRGGRPTVHEPEERGDAVRLVLVPPATENEAHMLLDAKSFQPVTLDKAVTFTVPSDALAEIIEYADD